MDPISSGDTGARFVDAENLSTVLSIMVHIRTALTLGAIVTFALAGSTIHALTDRAPLSIAVEIQNQTTVDPKTLFFARAEAARLYRELDVELVWVEANSNLLIVLAPEREACARAAGPRTLGQAVVTKTSRTGRVAYVYVDRVEDLAAAAEMNPADILGYVMAHEMAHLLGVSHAENGLMRAGWNQSELTLASRGLLHFSAPQRQILRQTITSLVSP